MPWSEHCTSIKRENLTDGLVGVKVAASFPSLVSLSITLHALWMSAQGFLTLKKQYS
jgi:hypothetical protein